MAVIGCDIPVRQVVGAEKIADAKAGIWTKTHFYEKGGFLHARTYLVAAGEPCVMEFRIDLRPLLKVATRIHQRMHDEMSKKAGRSPTVGFSFSKAWRGIKKTAKAIGKSKLVKAVGKGIKAVASSKIVGALATGLAVAVPVIGVPALAAYGTAKAAIKAVEAGKKLTSTANTARRTISTATSAVAKVDSAKAQAPARVQANASIAKQRAQTAAAQIAARAKAQAASLTSSKQAAAVKAQAASQAKATLAQGNAQAAAAAKGVVSQVKAAEARVAPVVNAAASIQAKLQDPAVRAKLLAIRSRADGAKKVLTDIKNAATYGSGPEKLDAQKSAAIVNLVARNEARIQAISQVNAGGLPSMLIDSRGRIVPGRYRIVAKTGGRNPDVLYKGPKSASEAGAFTRVSGDPDSEVGASSGMMKTWTVELFNPHLKRWTSQAVYGARFKTHAEASEAAQWYEKNGYRSRAATVLVPRRRTRVGASPFPPPSPRDKRAKEAEYVAWLKRHRVGASPVTIGCPCSDQGTLF